jgi:hypothetical protein
MVETGLLCRWRLHKSPVFRWVIRFVGVQKSQRRLVRTLALSIGLEAIADLRKTDQEWRQNARQEEHGCGKRRHANDEMCGAVRFEPQLGIDRAME